VVVGEAPLEVPKVEVEVGGGLGRVHRTRLDVYAFHSRVAAPDARINRR